MEQLPPIRQQAEQIVKVWRATDQTDELLEFYIRQAISDNVAQLELENESLNREMNSMLSETK